MSKGPISPATPEAGKDRKTGRPEDRKRNDCQFILTQFPDVATIRNMSRTALLFCAVCTSFLVGCQSPYYADRGAGLGAITGGLAGAAIGEHNGNPLAGALLGAAGGGIAGNLIGTTMDREIARNQALVEERVGRQMANAVTIHDVITMTQAGLPDDVIITHIRAHGVAQAVQVNDLIALRDARVSNAVIQTMQSPPQLEVARIPDYRPAPVIVEEYYYAPPRPRFYYHHHHAPRCYPRPHGVSWGVSVHNH